MDNKDLIRNCSLTGAVTCFFAVFFAFLVFGPASASAHRVTVFAWVDGETVHTESKFPGGKRVKAGKIEVYDQQGSLLLHGITDDRGEFSFKLPAKAPLKIVLQAGMGHRGEWTLTEEDMGGSVSGKVFPESPPGSDSGAKKEAAPIAAGPCISSEEIQRAVEKALEKRLGPVTRMLADLQEKGPSVHDILGGIGYILGLVGIAAYFHFRKRRTDSK